MFHESLRTAMTVALLGLVLGACSTTHKLSPDYYSRDLAGKYDEVFYGKVLFVRRIELGGTTTGAGTGALGIAGAVAGLGVSGTDSVKVISAITAGSFGTAFGGDVEERLTREEGKEVVVRFCKETPPPKESPFRDFSVVYDKDTNFKKGNCVRVLVGPSKSRVRLVNCETQDRCPVRNCPADCTID